MAGVIDRLFTYARESLCLSNRAIPGEGGPLPARSRPPWLRCPTGSTRRWRALKTIDVTTLGDTVL
jgi:hypothetical protein